jgi:hypothetical protein
MEVCAQAATEQDSKKLLELVEQVKDLLGEKERLGILPPKPDKPAQAMPIELRNKWAFVKADLVLPGPVTVKDSFLIDSGSSDEVDHPIVMNLETRVPTTSGVGFGTQIQGATAQATSLRLGRYSIIAPTVSCCGARDATSRLIGNEVLRRFTVTFDYPSSRIFITPNSYFEKTLRPSNN